MDYKTYIARKMNEYGKEFNPKDLAVQFIPYYESGQRVEVGFVSSSTGKVYETKRGTIGVTTGQQPVFILMLTKRSMGSSYTLSAKDKIIKVV